MSFFEDHDFDATLSACKLVLEAKGKDYTVGSPDRLANFNRAGELLGMRPEQVLAVYWYKHVTAVLSYIKTGGQSESEPIEGRITDCINYLLLFSKLVAEKKRSTAPPAPKVFDASYRQATCRKCKRAPIDVNDECLCLRCFSDVGGPKTALKFTPASESLVCVSCPARYGAERVWVDSSGQCSECFIGDHLEKVCIQCKKPGVLNVAGHCYDCAMRSPNPGKWAPK